MHLSPVNSAGVSMSGYYVCESSYVAQPIIKNGSDEMKTQRKRTDKTKAIGNAATLATNLIRLVSYRSFVASLSVWLCVCVCVHRYLSVLLFSFACRFSIFPDFFFFFNTLSLSLILQQAIIRFWLFSYRWMRLDFFIWLSFLPLARSPSILFFSSSQ